MFDAIEAINDIIDDINDDVAEYTESCYEEIYDELCYRVKSGELSLEEAEMINEKAYDKYVSESFIMKKSPLKDKLEKIKEIKNAKPGEFDDNKEIKKFVDDNYDDIIRASKLLQEEPDKLSKESRDFLVSILISFCGFLGGAALSFLSPVGSVISGLSFIWFFIGTFVNAIIAISRENADMQAMKDLSKIKVALKKLENKKFATKYKKKISNLIQSIDDAETDIYTKFKNVKESAYNEIYDELCYRVECGDLTLEEAEMVNETAYNKFIR